MKPWREFHEHYACAGSRYRQTAQGLSHARKRMFIFVQLSVALALLTFTLACSTPPDEAQFKAGMARSEIIEQFGEPANKEIMVKTSPHMLGPIEDFWSSLPDQTRVEIWSYPAEGGNVELYFVNGEEIPSGRGFALTGVDY
jgi:hypothetical protein